MEIMNGWVAFTCQNCRHDARVNPRDTESKNESGVVMIRCPLCGTWNIPQEKKEINKIIK